MPGDFQPGAETGYSPLVSFDVLGHIIELLSGTDLQSSLTVNIFEPLGMPDTAFTLTPDQTARLVSLHEYADEGLLDVSTTEPMLVSIDSSTGRYSGAAALFRTLDDYDRFAQMLAGGGHFDEATVLQPDTLDRLITERSTGARAAPPGIEWGLGVIVYTTDTDNRARGSWGWSGAFGGHFVIDPTNQLTTVLMINRSNIGQRLRSLPSRRAGNSQRLREHRDPYRLTGRRPAVSNECPPVG